MSGPFDRTVLWLTWRQLFARRRIYLALGFSVLPLLFTVFFKFAAEDGDGVRFSFFSMLNREIIIGTLVPLAAAVFGTTAFGGELDDGTLVYLLVKPIRRWRIALSKYVVAALSTVAVMLVAMMLPWLALRGAQVSTDALVGFVAGGAVGAVLYCALFLLLGLVSRRALVLSLLYVVAFEAVLSRNLVGAKSLSVREFAVSVSQAASSGAIVLEGYVVPISTVWTVSAVILVAALSLALWKLSRYEVAEQV
jgi:ABC-2 type transport system permease protein